MPRPCILAFVELGFLADVLHAQKTARKTAARTRTAAPPATRMSGSSSFASAGPAGVGEGGGVGTGGGGGDGHDRLNLDRARLPLLAHAAVGLLAAHLRLHVLLEALLGRVVKVGEVAPDGDGHRDDGRDNLFDDDAGG